MVVWKRGKALLEDLSSPPTAASMTKKVHGEKKSIIKNIFSTMVMRKHSPFVKPSL